MADGQVPVIAGTGSNSTSHAIELTRQAEAAGADAILSVVPYYNKPTQDGLCAHFRAIAGSTGLPIILYDVPSRTGCSLADETIGRLIESPQFIGLKDATGDATRPSRLRPVVGPDFRLLSGDDATALSFFAQGGNGCISVTSNIAPGLCREMYLAFQRGEAATAKRLSVPIVQMTTALFWDSNPGALKYCLSILGLMPDNVRLPLVEPSDRIKAELAIVLTDMCYRYAEYMIDEIPDPARRRAGLTP